MHARHASQPVAPARRLSGTVHLPGDKSVSHRYALLAALADGPSTIARYAPGADCASTLHCLQQLGVPLSRDGDRVTINGLGVRQLLRPATALDCGNSGSTMRMLAGVLAAHLFDATLTGDDSLRRRPMRRVALPLEQMGAAFRTTNGCPPVTVTGASLRGIDFSPEIPSAQVKSAVLLAGLQATGTTRVVEPASTRDHTERALLAFGAQVECTGRRVVLEGGQRLRAGAFDVPGDISSAAFWAVAAAALPRSIVELREVGLNPTRSAILDVLEQAGAVVTRELGHISGGEPVGTVVVEHSALAPLTITPARVPGLIDELPALAALGTFCGIHVTGAGELRHKESDRITALVSGLRALGADAHELPDGFVVRPCQPLAGGVADACGDHRLAMAFAVAALGARSSCRIAGAESVAVSYPGFFDVLESLYA